MEATERFARRFKRLVRDAEKAGVALVADADAIAVRFVSQDQVRDADDLRGLGVDVQVHGSCGGASYTTSGVACSQCG